MYGPPGTGKTLIARYFKNFNNNKFNFKNLRF